MVDINADVRNHGTNTIAEVICHGDKLNEAAWCSVAVQTRSDLRICHGAKVFKRTDEGIRVQEQGDFYSVQEQPAKIVTKK